MTTVNGITYIKEHSNANDCTGCVGEYKSDLCSELSRDCHYAIYVEPETTLPEGTYKGFNPAIVEEFIKGKIIEYSMDNGKTWTPMLRYRQDIAHEIYRVSNNNYLFRVKQPEVVKYMYLNDAMGSDSTGSGFNAKVTFINHKPTKVELL